MLPPRVAEILRAETHEVVQVRKSKQMSSRLGRRTVHGTRSRAVAAALGINPEGRRRVMAAELANRESKNSWGGIWYVR